jgi:uncharacterized protein YegP (UPF0339 family)
VSGKFEIFKDRAGEWRFRLKASNGEIIAASEGYTTQAACEAGVRSVAANAPNARVVNVTKRPVLPARADHYFLIPLAALLGGSATVTRFPLADLAKGLSPPEPLKAKPNAVLMDATVADALIAELDRQGLAVQRINGATLGPTPSWLPPQAQKGRHARGYAAADGTLRFGPVGLSPDQTSMRSEGGGLVFTEDGRIETRSHVTVSGPNGEIRKVTVIVDVTGGGITYIDGHVPLDGSPPSGEEAGERHTFLDDIDLSELLRETHEQGARRNGRFVTNLAGDVIWVEDDNQTGDGGTNQEDGDGADSNDGDDADSSDDNDADSNDDDDADSSDDDDADSSDDDDADSNDDDEDMNPVREGGDPPPMSDEEAQRWIDSLRPQPSATDPSPLDGVDVPLVLGVLGSEIITWIIDSGGLGPWIQVDPTKLGERQGEPIVELLRREDLLVPPSSGDWALQSWLSVARGEGVGRRAAVPGRTTLRTVLMDAVAPADTLK